MYENAGLIFRERGNFTCLHDDPNHSQFVPLLDAFFSTLNLEGFDVLQSTLSFVHSLYHLLVFFLSSEIKRPG